VNLKSTQFLLVWCFGFVAFIRFSPSGTDALFGISLIGGVGTDLSRSGGVRNPPIGGGGVRTSSLYGREVVVGMWC